MLKLWGVETVRARDSGAMRLRGSETLRIGCSETLRLWKLIYSETIRLRSFEILMQ